MNNEELDLADAVIVAMEDMTQRVISLYDESSLENATTILNEWTLPNNTCVLTKYVQDDTESIEGDLLYCSVSETNVGFGTFVFDPDAELPVDNN